MKKFLSLVLALVMTMSLVTISAGAKDFTDADKVTYTEAVDVLSAVKVIDGYTDGAFKPTTPLNRGQAAKILCNLILGPTTASALKADAAPFKDVAADSTFAAYIAYCAKEGIIDGYTDGTFRPTAPLTGYAFMKLLLGSLGYDKDVEGYNGPNWSINVAKRALAIGLDDGLVADFDGTKIVTREEACLFALNTMKADMVEYDAKTNISVGGAEVVISGSKAKEVANNAKTETIFEDDTVQFAEKYFTNLKLNDAARDDFARPSNQWKVKAETIGTYSQTPDLTYTKGVKNGAIYADLGLGDKIDASDVKVYVNGVSIANTKSLVKGGDSTMGQSGNGVLTEVFYDDKADTVELIQIHTYVGQVAKTVKATDAKDAYIVVTPDGTAATRPAGVGGSGLEFETDEVFEDDAIVLYTYSEQGTGSVQSVVVAESVEGTVTETQNKTTNLEDSQSVTIDGETYKISKKFVGEQLGDITLKSDYKVYLDSYGYMIKVEEVQNLSSDYALVLAINDPTNFVGYKAKLLFGDGTEKVVETAKNYHNEKNNVDVNDIVSYKVEDGVYTLKAVKADKQVSAPNQGANKFELLNSKAAIKVDGTEAKLKANSNTTFVVKDIYDDEIDVYTGVKAAPTIKSTATVKADVYAYCKNGVTGMTTIMFILAQDDSIIEDENNKVLYVAQESVSNLIHDNTGDYFTYNAIVNGEITTVKVDEEAVATEAPKELFGMYKSYSTNSKGVITKLTDLANFNKGADNEYLAGIGISKTSADYTVTLDTENEGSGKTTLTVADDAKIYYVDKDGEISVSSYNAIAVDTDDVVFAFVDDYMVKTLVIEEVRADVNDDGVVVTGGDYWTVTGSNVYSTGYAYVTLKATRPAYIDAARALPYSYDILVNGKLYDHVTGTIDANATTATATWKNDGVRAADYRVAPIAETDVIEISNFKFDLTGQAAVVKYYDGDNNNKELTINSTNFDTDYTTAKMYITAADSIIFKVKSDDSTTGKLKFTITGLVDGNITTATLPTTLTDANDTHTVVTGKKASGNDFVKVTIYGLNSLNETWNITTKAADSIGNFLGTNSAPTGVAISNFKTSSGADNSSTDKLGIYTGITSNTGIADGTRLALKVKVNDLTDVYAYDVTVKIAGQTFSKRLTSDDAADLGTITVNSDIEIAKADVTVTPVAKLALTSATIAADGSSVSLTFNYALNADTVTVDTLALTPSSTSTAAIDPNSIVVSGDTVTFSFVNGALKPTDYMTPATGIKTNDTPANACNAAKKAVVSINNGVYSIALADVAP